MTIRIVIVDDEPRNLTLIRDLLQMKGYLTREAADGKQGVDLAREWKPDLILMDIQMPVMDGMEATGILKTDDTTKHIPILALSSYAMTGDRERILAAGCDGYLSKPIDIKEFLATVAGYLAEKTGENEQGTGIQVERLT